MFKNKYKEKYYQLLSKYEKLEKDYNKLEEESQKYQQKESDSSELHNSFNELAQLQNRNLKNNIGDIQKNMADAIDAVNGGVKIGSIKAA